MDVIVEVVDNFTEKMRKDGLLKDMEDLSFIKNEAKERIRYLILKKLRRFINRLLD